MSNESMIVSVCVPLIAALLSFVAALYAAYSSRTTIQADLAIHEKCSKIEADSIGHLLPSLENRIAREVYGLIQSDCSWLNGVWAGVAFAVSLVSFVLSAVLISIGFTANKQNDSALYVGMIVFVLLCGITGISFGIINVTRYRSYRLFAGYLKGRIGAIEDDVKFVHSAVEMLTHDEVSLRASFKRRMEFIDEISRPFRELGSYPDDRMLLFPNELISDLESMQASIAESTHIVTVALQAIDESVDGRDEIKRQIEFLSKKSRGKETRKHGFDNVNQLTKELQNKKGELQRIERSLNSMQRATENALHGLRDAQDRGVFDNQVVIKGPSGLLLVSDRQSERKYDLNRFFEKPSGELTVFRSHDDDEVAVVAKPQADESLKVVGLLYQPHGGRNMESVLGYEIPTLSVKRKVE